MATQSTVRSKSAFLMCPPRYFDTHYLFNPWMSYRERVNRHRAWGQWRDLRTALEQAGAETQLIDPSPDSSAMVFTADAAMVLGGAALILPNDGPRGDLEPPLFRAWFRRHGYVTESMPGTRLDGGNIVSVTEGNYAVGLKPGAAGRSEAYLKRRLAMTSEANLWPIGLVDRQYLHLDMVLSCPGNGPVLVFLDAIHEGGRGFRRSLPVDKEVITVGREDAEAFALNLISIGDVIITGKLSTSLRKVLTSHGYWVEELALSEFIKAGGGAKCLTLPLHSQSKGEIP